MKLYIAAKLTDADPGVLDAKADASRLAEALGEAKEMLDEAFQIVGALKGQGIDVMRKIHEALRLHREGGK